MTVTTHVHRTSGDAMLAVLAQESLPHHDPHRQRHLLLAAANEIQTRKGRQNETIQADPDDDVNWLHAIDRETGRVIKTLKGPSPPEPPATSGNEPKGAIEYVNGAIWMGQWWHKVSRDKTPNVSWMTLYKLDARNGQVQETLRLGEHKDLRTREDRPDDIGAGIFSWLNDLAKTGTRAIWLLVHCELGDDFQELYLYDTGDEPWMQADSRSGVLAPGETKVVKLSLPRGMRTRRRSCAMARLLNGATQPSASCFHGKG